MNLSDENFDKLLKQKLEAEPASAGKAELDAFNAMLDANVPGPGNLKPYAFIFSDIFICGTLLLMLFGKASLTTPPASNQRVQTRTTTVVAPHIPAGTRGNTSLPKQSTRAPHSNEAIAAASSTTQPVAAHSEPGAYNNNPVSILAQVKRHQPDLISLNREAAHENESTIENESAGASFQSIQTVVKQNKANSDEPKAPLPAAAVGNDAPATARELSLSKQPIGEAIAATANDSAKDVIVGDKKEHATDTTLTAVAVSRPDSAQASGDPVPRTRPKRYSTFNLLATANAFKPLQNTSSYTQFDVKPGGGFAYGYDITPRFNLGIGLQYCYRQSLNSSRSYTATDYSFGHKKYSNSITTQSLHYIQVPAEIKFNNRFSFTVYAGLLIGGNNLLKTYQADSYSNTTREQFGFPKGFQKFDWGIGAGYEVPVTPRMSIRIAGRYGLTDITRNSYYSNNRFNNNAWLQLQLIYELYSHMIRPGTTSK